MSSHHSHSATVDSAACTVYYSTTATSTWEKPGSRLGLFSANIGRIRVDIGEVTLIEEVDCIARLKGHLPLFFLYHGCRRSNDPWARISVKQYWINKANGFQLSRNPKLKHFLSMNLSSVPPSFTHPVRLPDHES
ncbi:unnamed protein product [Citrullus colocynthis]|uniref:Uncharacterized protein n=1 Tax=Citrullus colocynthis TaxID=252529 RepID=A0ABP0YVL8_9ROSI